MRTTHSVLSLGGSHMLEGAGVDSDMVLLRLGQRTKTGVQQKRVYRITWPTNKRPALSSEESHMLEGAGVGRDAPVHPLGPCSRNLPRDLWRS